MGKLTRKPTSIEHKTFCLCITRMYSIFFITFDILLSLLLFFLAIFLSVVHVCVFCVLIWNFRLHAAEIKEKKKEICTNKDAFNLTSSISVENVEKEIPIDTFLTAMRSLCIRWQSFSRLHKIPYNRNLCDSCEKTNQPKHCANGCFSPFASNECHTHTICLFCTELNWSVLCV